jgi:esterase/lipase
VVLPLMEKQIPVPIETAWFDVSGHVMLLDTSGVVVAQTVADFFQRQL